MLDGGIIQRLLEEKWKTFARVRHSNSNSLKESKFFIFQEPISQATAHPIHSPLLPVTFRVHASCY